MAVPQTTNASDITRRIKATSKRAARWVVFASANWLAMALAIVYPGVRIDQLIFVERIELHDHRRVVEDDRERAGVAGLGVEKKAG